MRAFAILSRFAAITLVLTVPLQPPFSNTTTLPTHYGLLVFPQFQALDVFGPLDVLNTLSMLYGNSTTMYLSIFSKTLEPVSTASKATHVNGNFGQSIVPTTTFAEHLAVGTSSDPRGDIEVLIVPGGMGTRQNMTEEVGFVKAVYPKVNSFSGRYPFFLPLLSSIAPCSSSNTSYPSAPAPHSSRVPPFLTTAAPQPTNGPGPGRFLQGPM